MTYNESTRKVLAVLTSVAMVLTLVAGVVAVTPASADTAMATASYNYTRSLTVGSRGDDVTALQAMLNAGGYLQVAPTGYFGSLTKRALAAWQAAVGITPASGYFGTITRKYIATNGSPSPVGGNPTPGCSTGALFNSMTGQPCGGVSPIPGCTAGALFSSTTGQSCSGGTPVSSGTEGTLTVTQSPMAVSNANITTNTDVPVYGLQLKAQLGNVTVQRIDLDVADAITGGATENPGNFINNIKVKDDAGNILLNRSVSLGDFTSGVSSTDYYIRLSGINFVVPAGQTKNLIVTFSTNGGIDNSRTLTLAGYPTASPTNALQAVSGNNIVAYYPLTGITTTQVFQKPGQSSLSVGTDASNPVATTNYLDPTTGASKVTTLAFNALSSTGDSIITEVDASVNSVGTAPTAVYLYDGTNLLASRAVSSTGSTTVTFTNLSDVISAGTQHVFTLKLDAPSTANGASATTTVTNVYYQQTNGSSNVKTPNITGNTQSFAKVSPNITLVSAPTPTANTNSNTGSTTGVTGNMVIKVHPAPGQMVQPVASDFTLCFATSVTSGTCKKPDSLSLAFSPTVSSASSPLPANSDTTVTLNYSVNPSTLQTIATGNVQYYVFLTKASTTVNDINGTPTNVTLATSSLTSFVTQNTVNVNY